MSDKRDRGDYYTGIPWVNVTPEQARAHPSGKLGLILWAIAAYFIAVSGLKFYWTLDFGETIGVAVLNGIWPLATGILLLMRAPWSVFMAAVSAALTIYALVRGMGSDASIYYLLETVANVGILFYLTDGDRPNLIYRHRYRKYSVLREDGQGADATTAPVDPSASDR